MNTPNCSTCRHWQDVANAEPCTRPDPDANPCQHGEEWKAQSNGDDYCSGCWWNGGVTRHLRHDKEDCDYCMERGDRFYFLSIEDGKEEFANER